MKFTKISIITFLIALCSACANNKPQTSLTTNNYNLSKADCKAHPFLNNYNCSIASIENQANEGDADAAYALGYLYYYGIGVPRDQQNAKLWIERAANLGQESAIQAQQLMQKRHPAQQQQQQQQQTNNTKLSEATAEVRHPKPVEQKTRRGVARYTVQLAASHDKKTLNNLKKQYNLHGVTIGTRQVMGQNWYVMMQGNYPSKQSALSAISNFPEPIKDLKPWVRKL